MKILKRTLAMLLVLTMVLGMVPFAAFAEETAAITLGTKPADGTVTGQPFNTTVSANYRIPGLVNHNGILIATADARWNNEKDGGGMDLVVSRSDDGKNWNYTFAGYLGDNGNEWNPDSTTLMDPVITSDGDTLYLLADMYPAGYSISESSTANVFSDTDIGFDASGNLLLSDDNRKSYGYYLKDGKIYSTQDVEQAGYEVKGWYDLYQNGVYKTNLFFADSPFQLRATSYICLSSSVDNGVTWSAPKLLNVKPEGVKWMVLGPGSGLVTAKGELAFTAYDNTNIYLIHGKDNNWSVEKTPSATNESSIIELPNGDIRAFVKRDNKNTIAYVDFLKTTDGYTATALTDTGIPNFSNCMVSSLTYSRTLGGKDVVLVCCPSKSSGGRYGGRFNGKIFVFTLNEDNTMNHVADYAVNGEDAFFAYSNMAEKKDGTIALLYEDSCISYAAGNYSGDASHISYTEIDLEKKLGLVFDDVFNWGSDSDTVEVQVPGAAGVTHMHTRPAEVNNMNVAYSAYEIVLCKDAKNDCTAEFTCANVHTGTAIVELPLTESLKAADDVKGFVVNGDGSIDSVFNVEKNETHVTFEAPHFSVVGIAAMTEEEIAQKNAVKVTLYSDETKTIVSKEIVTPGSHTSDAADVTWSTEEVEIAEYKGIQGTSSGFNGSQVDLSSCLYTFTSTGTTDQYTITAKTSDNAAVYVNPHGTKGKPNVAGSDAIAVDVIAGLTSDQIKLKITAGSLHFHADQANPYWNWCTDDPDGGCNVLMLYRPVQGDEASSKEIPGYVKIAGKDAIESGSKYLIVGKNKDENYYVMYPTTDTSSNRSQMAKVSEVTTTVTGTKITITGKTEDTTSVTIGNTLYNITVEMDAVDVTLNAGENKTVTLDGVNYTTSSISKPPKDTVATIGSVVSSPIKGKELRAVTSVDDLSADKQYLIVANRPAGIGGDEVDSANSVLTSVETGGGLHMNGPASADSTDLWTITPVTGGYTITQGNKYVSFGKQTAEFTETETVLALQYRINGGYQTGWTIERTVDNSTYYLSDLNGTGSENAYGYGTLADDGNYWTIYEVASIDVGYTTDVTFNGVAGGNTEAVIGHTKFNITVNQAELNEVEVELQVGETKDYTIDGVAYTDDDVIKAENADTVVVTTVVGNTVVNRELVAATEINSGAKYMIISNRTGADGYGGQYGNYYVTNNEVTKTGAAGLELAAASSDSAIWTITATEDGYYTISDGTENINIQAKNNVTLDPDAVVQIRQSAYETGCWEILSTAGVYLNYFNSFQTDTKGAASAWDTPNDPGSQWQLYELIEETVSSTEITFTGKKVGQTQVTVGSTKYTITVEPAAVENLTIQIGKNKTFTVDGVAYTDTDVIKAENADTVVLTNVDGNAVIHREVSTVPATEITSGAKYVIVSAATPDREMIANTGTLTNGYMGLELAKRSATNNVAANAIWTITANDDGTYTVSNGGLNVAIKGDHMATLEENAVVQIKKGNNNTDDWVIYANVDGNDYCLNDHNSFGEAFSHGSAMAAFTNLNGNRSQLKLYEVTEETESSTEITFTGKAEGKTQVTVGATQYNITVVPVDVRNITLHIGATETFTIEGYTYSMADATTKPNTAYATLKSVKAVPTLVPVTAIESGKQYLIVNKSTGDVLTDTVVSASGTWGAKTGLNTTGKASANSAERWTITGADGSYTVAQNGKYLVVAGFHADMSTNAANLTLAYTDSGWTIYDNTTYQALVGHKGPGYYLSDKVDEANGYAYDAMGSSDEGNAARYWDIYEIDPQGATEVVFTGVAKGDTTAVIGHVTFNITVVEPDPVELDITLYKDATATYVIEGLAYGDANVKLYPDETAAKLDSVTSKVIPGVKRLVQITSEDQIVSGKSYLIATRNNNSVLTSQAQTETALDIGSIASVNSTELWTFTGGNGVYTISPAENSYLNLADATGATVTGTAQSLTVEWLQDASTWTIAGTGTNKYLNNHANGNDLAATWSDNDAGSQWRLFEIVTEVPDRTITEVTFTGVTPGETTTAQVGHVTYNITVAEKDVRPITLYVGVTQDEFINNYAYKNTQSEQPNNTYAYIHSVTTEDGGTKVVFSGVAKTPEGEVITATVGHVTYEITVKDLHSGEDVPGFNCVIGEGEYESGEFGNENLTGKEVKSLRISEGMVFNLGVDITDAESITWNNADSTIAEVDQTGKITAKSVGTTLITATVTKGDATETIAVHVTVVPSMVEGYSADEIAHVVYYIDTVHMTDPYYTMFLSSENSAGPVAEHTMVMVSQGEVIVLQRPKNTAFAMVWTSDPWDGHALTYMAATGTQGQYFPLQSDNGDLETGTVDGIEYFKGSQAYKNIISVGNAAGASWQAGFDAMLEYSVHVGDDIWQEFGCEGAMSMTRKITDNYTNTATSLSFISEKLPEVSKTINGILGNSGKKSEWKPYQEGMYTEVGEHVYYNITVTQDAPHSWQRNQDGSFIYATDEDGNVLLDAEGNKLKLAALEYDMYAMLRDRLMDANDQPIPRMNDGPYFYTKELDADDGDQSGNGIEDDDGYIADVTKQKNALDIHEDLNAPWTQAQIDAGSRTLTYYVVYRILQEDFGQLLKNGVSLNYTYGSAYSRGSNATEASATASMRILGESLQDLVVDFGQPVSFTISGNQLTSEISPEKTKAAHGSLRYGDIAITQTVAEGTDSLSYNITYTPNKIMNGYDVVYLMNNNGELVNYFRVYPATTVYYEEGFLVDLEENQEKIDANKPVWNTDKATKGTAGQTYETLEQEGKVNPYGYDPIYADDLNGASGSYISANTIGAHTSFTFTGTGFDLYANCAPDSGYVAITVRRNNANTNPTTVKLITVNTKTGAGNSFATSEQGGNEYHMPIVSLQDLAHATYTVEIRKIMKDNLKVVIDGVRIYNTIDVKQSSVYAENQEDNPAFFELRDYVLNAVDVNYSDTDGFLTEAASRIYNDLAEEEGSAAIVGKATERTKITRRTIGKWYKNGCRSVEVIETTYRVTLDENGNIISEVQIGEPIRNIKYKNVYGEFVDSIGDSEVVKTEEEEQSTQDSNIQDILDNGPKNELLLYPQQSMVFKFTTDGIMQIGLKAPVGEATAYSLAYSYTVTDENGEETIVTETVAENAALNSCVDMFYSLGNESGTERTYVVTVTNTGDAVLSATKLKTRNDPDAEFTPLTLMDVQQILLAAGYPADEETPVGPSTPEGTTPEGTKPEGTKPEGTKPEDTKPEDTGCAKDETCVLSKYGDIETTAWYHDGVHFCVEKGLMNGMGEGIFAPNEPTTRAQLVTMLYRLMGNPEAEGKTQPFTDVAEGEWYYDAIVWAYSENVVKGISETEFAPHAKVTREQVATILHRFLAAPEGSGKLDSFSDAASVSTYAKDAMVWAVGEGLINGVELTNGTVLLDPTGTATRAQIATILYRHLENA